MKLYGIWSKEEEVLKEYLQGKDNQYFGTKEEIQDELGWLNCECDGDVDVYFQVAILDTETGLIELKTPTAKSNFDF